MNSGVEVLDPIQVKANGMVPAELKAEFGNKLCFSGGVEDPATALLSAAGGRTQQQRDGTQ